MARNEIAVFGADNEFANLPTVKRASKLADKMSTGGASLRRIATNTNGTFKRIVGGEQIGKAVPHQVDVIMVDLLKEVSREFYAAAYDPDAKATLPDCWANDGTAPGTNVPNRQSDACVTCPQNIAGSGKGNSRACRFRRRVAVLIAGDPSGEVYQMSFASQSLFGKGTGNTHPFESYKNFLAANGEGLDTVVTRVMYDLDADTLTLKFRAARHLTEEEAELVDAAQADEETRKYIELTAAAMDGATKGAATPQAKANMFAEEEPEEAPKAKRGRPAKAEAPAAPAKPTSPFEDAEEAVVEEVAEEVEATEPVKRGPKKLDIQNNEERGKKLTAVLSAWADEEDEEAG